MEATRLIVMLLGMSVASSDAAERGYLSTVGPAPLRFVLPRVPEKQPQPPLQAEIILAPETAVVPTTTTNQTALPTTELLAATNTVPVTIVEPPSKPAQSVGEPVQAPPAEVTEPPRTFAPPPGLDAAMPQPQLFLQYFTPDFIPATNGYSVVVPVGFLPPQPRSGSSSARYQIEAPEKR